MRESKKEKESERAKTSHTPDVSHTPGFELGAITSQKYNSESFFYKNRANRYFY